MNVMVEIEVLFLRLRDIWAAALASPWLLPLLGVVICLLAIAALRFIGDRKATPELGSVSAGRSCRWREDYFRRSETFTRWQCRTCGVDAFSSDGRPPKECKRYLRETQL